MKIVCIKNGKEFKRDPEDLDAIPLDVIVDYVKEIEHFENNPNAKLVIDCTKPGELNYKLVNCGLEFSSNFNKFKNNLEYV